MEVHMPAPFRINKPSQAGTVLTARRATNLDSIKHWMERLMRLIPSEVVAVFLAGKGYAASWPGTWSVVCLILVLIVRIWGTNDPHKGVQWIAVGASAFSFVIWVYAIGGQFLWFTLPSPGIAPAAVLVWTVLVPIIYKGD
jgi:hypothetical protein